MNCFGAGCRNDAVVCAVVRYAAGEGSVTLAVCRTCLPILMKDMRHPVGEGNADANLYQMRDAEKFVAAMDWKQ